MKIIDAHAHAFKDLCGFGADGELRAIGNGQAQWATGQVTQIIPPGYGQRSFTIKALLRLMDAHQVEKAVLLQGGFLGFANTYVREAIDAYPNRLQGAGTFDPFCRHASQILDNLLGPMHFRIFKFEVSVGCGIMGNHPDFPLDGEMMMPFYQRIADRNGVVAFDLGSPGDGSNQPKAIAHIAKSFPSLQIVVCHLGSPRLGQKALFEEGMRIMQADNIHFDLAALFWKVRPEAYPFPTARQYAVFAKDLVGADHLMWGSDAPSTVCKVDYQQQLAYLMPLFTAEEQRLVFHDNALNLYFAQRD